MFWWRWHARYAPRGFEVRVFYVCYFIVVGVSTPFFPAYLRRIGLSGQSVSAILAVAPALQLGVPLAWGWLADRTRRPDWVLRVLCVGACAASVPVVFVRSMPTLFFLYLAQQIFAGSITGMADALAVEKSRLGDVDYGRLRLWGSISFVATSLTAGLLIDWRAVPTGDVLVPGMVSIGFALSLLAAARLRGRAACNAPRLGDVRALLGESRFRFLLVVAGLHWLALVPFHGFFGILLQDRGVPATTTGHAFMVGAVAEIAVFVVFARLRRRFTLSALLAASFVASALRWMLIAYTRSVPVVMVTQVLHALTFGLFWATSMAWIAECVSPRLRATGQMMFSTTLGLGAVAGLLSAGALYDAAGGAGLAFGVAGILEIVPFALVLGYWKRRRSPAPTMEVAVEPD